MSQIYVVLHVLFQHKFLIEKLEKNKRYLRENCIRNNHALNRITTSAFIH